MGYEIKYSASPKVTKSMRAAIETLQLDHLTILYPGERRIPIAADIEAVGLGNMNGL
ncbi:MAG: hypothetical protein KJ558_07325 [Gammaproteobacteria bacterium]|nr:hypothetical protein [Gammaproteobacteria bacterium]MBU1654628.1 hypothetical protein [Gammaproteobacteria bacterium]MBU1959958.1 hypothetical protein [Gammaproteobacteria bacterium]